MANILFLTPQLPYPARSGGTIKTYALIDYLSAHHSVTVASLLKGDDVANVDHYKSLVPLRSLISEVISRPRSVLNYIRSFICNVPLSVYRNASENLLVKILAVVDEYDVIIVDHYLMFQYVPRKFSGRVVLHQHNAEFVMWERLAEVERSLIKRALVKLEAHRIRSYEKLICAAASAVLAAPNDINNLVGIGVPVEKFFVTYHLGAESATSAPALKFNTKENSIMYVGTLSWEANIDGLIWFIESAWSTLKRKIPNLVFFVIGKNPDRRLCDLVRKHEDIILTGFVDDTEEYFRRCKIFVAPLRFGSGMKVKVLSAMGRGIPTVTTNVGAEGIDAVDLKHLAISDNIDGIVEKIVALINDEALWSLMARESRKLVEENYTWKHVFERLELAIAG